MNLQTVVAGGAYVVVAVPFVFAALSDRVGRRDASLRRSGWRTEASLWLSMAVVLVLLGLWRFFAIGDLIGEQVRDAAFVNGVYEERRLFQREAVDIGLMVVALGLVWLIISLRAMATATLVALMSVAALLLLALMRLISLHGFDAWLDSPAFLVSRAATLEIAMMALALPAAVVAGWPVDRRLRAGRRRRRRSSQPE